ncbi:MAG: hypothetical protein JEY91_05560 [Spirochaetaceae bacterium]|nr:hypothetical protein [Spirochaetaceae bacterium]
MKEEIVNQYRHFWKTYEKIVFDFDEKSWLMSGFGLTTPASLAFHILQSTKYYMKDSTAFVFQTGETCDSDCSKLNDCDLPDKEDILFLVGDVQVKSEKWLQKMVLKSENHNFGWTGKNNLSVALFLIRHNQFHLGEMNALLNEYKKGKAKDHFAEALMLYK